MYAASTPSGIAERSSDFRSTATTSYFPSDASASATFLPLTSDISRSFEVPPISTAIFFTIFVRFLSCC